jgi:hypothetical protein
MQCRRRSHESYVAQNCVRIGSRGEKAVVTSEPTNWGSAMLGVSHCLRAAAAAILISLGALAAAQAAGWLEKSFYMSGANYSDWLPPCEAALGTIASEFAIKESRFWNSDLQILSFDKVREMADPWAPGTIPRRFCRAVAMVSDGRKHVVNYWIGEDTSIAGAFPGVEWCVVGLDRNWAYNPRCKMALP